MQHLQSLFAEADLVAIFQPTIRCEVLRRQAVAPSLLGQSPRQVLVAAMRPFKAGARDGGKTRRMPRMICMSMSHEDELEPQRLPLEEALDPIEIAAGIDHCGGARRRAGLDPADGRDDGGGTAGGRRRR